MKEIHFDLDNGEKLTFIQVEGTGDGDFLFGPEDDQLKVSIKDFYISKFPVTQSVYQNVMGENPSEVKGDQKPVTDVSYDDIVVDGGFLASLNHNFQRGIGQQFRLPTETEWEYAARGGVNWTDLFQFSGSDDLDEVGWYDENSDKETKAVGQKDPNQLGLYEMSGNVWEWCQDFYHADPKKIPLDGSPCMEYSKDRVLRGGCFNNWAIHCTSAKRYEIGQGYKDSCIGFRVAFSSTAAA